MKVYMQMVLCMLVLYVLRSTQASCPKPCTCSETHDGKKRVNCANGHLTSIPPNIHKDVTHLDLSGNQIQKISKDSFAGYSHLTVLYLDGNIISEIEPLSFQDLKQVELLSLTNNRLSKIGENAFAYIKGRADCFNGSRSCTLDLRMNDIRVIESNAFAWIMRLGVKIGGTKGTTTLKRYSFYGAKQIPSILIHDVANLQLNKHWLSESENIGLLSIKSSAIQNIVSFLFEGTSDICMMVFENNSFTTISPYGFSGIQFADAMCIDRLRLLQTEEGSESRPHSETSLYKLPARDDKYVGSQKPQINKNCGGTVIFKHCTFPVLSTDMFRDTNLVEIELTGCQITEMEADVFRGMGCLKNLYITDNIIKRGLSPGSFGSLNHLENVIFYRNELITIHDNAFKGTQQLKRLVFTLKPNKNLSLQSNALSGLTEIETIEITGYQSGLNSLMLHSGAFDKLVGVTNLTISSVRIPSLSEHTFQGVGKVQSLSFVDVHIGNFSSKAFSSVPIRTPISSFLITGDNTGITCDCDTLREVYNLNYMFEDYTIMCNSDMTDEGYISQKQTLSADLMEFKKCGEDKSEESSFNSANRNLSSFIVSFVTMMHISLVCYKNVICGMIR